MFQKEQDLEVEAKRKFPSKRKIRKDREAHVGLPSEGKKIDVVIRPVFAV